MEDENITTGYTCNKCGKIFNSKEEFIEIHKKEINKEENKKE